MCEQGVTMVTTETHQSQDLVVPPQNRDEQDHQDEAQGSPSSAMAGFSSEEMGQGPVNAITVLTLLDKLVNMLDTVQENQNKMEVHQVEMEGVVRGIQADMTKLSKSHSHTSNTVSKLLDKSRKLSVTMKEVREKMERQGAQVKKLEANHAHLIHRNNFKVLIFQVRPDTEEENEIPATVFVKDPPPFPRDGILEESEGAEMEGNPSQDGGLKTIELSSDEDVGLEAEDEDEDVDSLKKAFSRQNIEKKMTKIGTKIVSPEQREKIKQKTSSLKVSPLTLGIKKRRSSSDSHPPETSIQNVESAISEAEAQVSPPADTEQEVPFTEVHTQLAPTKEQEKEEEEEVVMEEGIEEGKKKEDEEDRGDREEGVSEEYTLSSTLRVEEKEDEQQADEEQPDKY
ncbi:Caveolae-associated protein 2 [Takifugu flavidus]|uniref:Caveolae-associated protein 2 n=1 Tax=Takifugu flavidus TaxID=433684 RepID=A0A5C6N9J3_9TELE|nr:Caveolae-associated protein 2 [Takifugu flavidus]